jgi:hypothetical protein
MVDEVERRAMAEGATLVQPKYEPPQKPADVVREDRATRILIDRLIAATARAAEAEPDDDNRDEATPFGQHSHYGWTAPQLEAAMAGVPMASELLRTARAIARDVWGSGASFETQEQAVRHAIELALDRVVTLARRASVVLPPSPTVK